MEKMMLGKKAGMTQLFDANGNAVPVTVIECGPIQVVQRKTDGVDHYDAVKVGFGSQKEHRLNKPQLGQFKAAGVEPKRVLREFRVASDSELKAGDQLIVTDCFEVGDHVDVVGTSKGKGFQGNIKRHNQKGGKEAHGSKYHRRVGSMGPSATPSRVMKGKKMPGHMGHERVTVQNLEVVLVDGERNILALKGAVPGIRGGFLEIRQTVKGKKA